jgi:hypothetical protein
VEAERISTTISRSESGALRVARVDAWETADVSNQIEPDFSAKHLGSPLQCGEGDISVSGIQQPADLAAACPHALRKRKESL